jgi:hypothetical protein
MFCFVSVGVHDGNTVLKLSGPELQQLMKLSSSDVKQLKDAVSQAVLQNQKASTGMIMLTTKHFQTWHFCNTNPALHRCVLRMR